MDDKQDKPNEDLAAGGGQVAAKVHAASCPACGGHWYLLSADRMGNITGYHKCLICHGSGVSQHVR